LSDLPTEWRLPRPKQRWHSFRGLLQRNKIVFETVAATALTIASICIAIYQSTTAAKQNTLIDKQNGLVDLQARVAEAQAMPTLEIAIKQILDPATNRADQNELIIDNSGGPTREFDCQAVYFIEIEIGEKLLPIPPPIHLSIPMNDYYAYQAVTAASKGHLATISGYQNNLNFVSFSRKLSAAAEDHSWRYANVDEKTFLRVQYTDVLDRSHEEYYEVAPVWGSRRLKTEEGRHYFAQASPMKRTSFRDLSIEKVAELVKSSKKQN
jgi:hypothetical protein